MFIRDRISVIYKRLDEKRRFIQVLGGPRQTGKTTLARQVMAKITMPSIYASADEPAIKSHAWIEQQWEIARAAIKKPSQKILLVLDEIQKLPQWSETVKKLWDEDTAKRRNVYVIILGSSPLLLQQGLTESLAGRFEVINVTHWSYLEMKKAFGWNCDTFMFYGGYPGSSSLIRNYERWSQYILNALVETSVSRDILLMTRIDKPVLLRRLFELGCTYSGQILSYQKMLGQLQDAGNTTTLAHYLELLAGAGLLMGIPKYFAGRVRQKNSSPKFQVLNTALMSAQIHTPLNQVKQRPELWGRIVESSIGAHLANGIKGKNIELYYWRENNKEVDFVLVKNKSVVAIEVKSGIPKMYMSGMESFCREYKNVPIKKLLVGKGGMPVEEFLSLSPTDLL